MLTPLLPSTTSFQSFLPLSLLSSFIPTYLLQLLVSFLLYVTAFFPNKAYEGIVYDGVIVDLLCYASSCVVVI